LRPAQAKMLLRSCLKGASRAWWFTPLIPTMQEIQVGRWWSRLSYVEGETSAKKKRLKTWLKCKTLNSNFMTAIKHESKRHFLKIKSFKNSFNRYVCIYLLKLGLVKAIYYIKELKVTITEVALILKFLVSRYRNWQSKPSPLVPPLATNEAYYGFLCTC
jgi:hypothetical protein